MNILRHFFLFLIFSIALKTIAQTKTLSRLIAISRFDFDGSAYRMSDTETYVYGPGRGGDDYYNLPYDNSLSFTARTATSLDSNIRNEKTYNSANKVLTHKQQVWTNSTLGWMNSIYSFYTYDVMNNEIEQLIQRWDFVSSSWENKDLLFKTYDASSNLITQTTQEWNKTLGIWENKRQFVNGYDAKKRITNVIYLIWDGSTWTYNTQDSYFFDTKDNLVSTLKFNWNNGLSSWDSSGKVETSFSSTNKKLIETNSDYYSGSWIPQRISEYFYNTNDSIYLLKYKDWKASSSVWSNQNKTDYLYNTAGQLIYQKSQRGLNDTGWQNYWQRDYEYDLAMNSVTQVHAWWRDMLNKYDTGTKITMAYNSYNQLTKYVWDFWDSSSKKFIPNEMSNYYYEEYTAGIKDVKSQIGSLVAYPIPATQHLNLEINWQERQNFSVTIHDAVGRELSYWTLKNEQHYKEHFSLDNFANGQFFIVVVTDKGDKISKSFIVQK